MKNPMLNKTNRRFDKFVFQRKMKHRFCVVFQELVKVEQEKIDVENERDSEGKKQI